ncbi:MAG: hypothetical protein VB106_04380 [Clostridiaceae bacterium]|nr:hypothetical protein [Clostridiaceae bacterium]
MSGYTVTSEPVLYTALVTVSALFHVMLVTISAGAFTSKLREVGLMVGGVVSVILMFSVADVPMSNSTVRARVPLACVARYDLFMVSVVPDTLQLLAPMEVVPTFTVVMLPAFCQVIVDATSA